jgi:hypothetical protein
MTTILTRQNVADCLQALIAGTKTREEVSAWACRYSLDDSLDIPDQAVSRALEAMSGADIFADMENYLYDVDDFRAWLEELSS